MMGDASLKHCADFMPFFQAVAEMYLNIIGEIYVYSERGISELQGKDSS